MIFPKRPSNLRFDEPGPEKVDKVLYRFFQSEMPEPWPACPSLPVDRQTPARSQSALRFLRVPARVAVAAAVVLLVCGYRELKNALPAPRATSGFEQLNSNPFGMLPSTMRGLDRTRSGRPVEFEMKASPDKKTILLQIQELPASK
jgi:hypothetical protein